jgi:glutamate/tyrosine decarboxylase-like PLP-dependent enzyme
MPGMEEDVLATPMKQLTTQGDIELDECGWLRGDFPNNVDLGRLHGLVSDHPDFEVFAEPNLDLYCFRYVPNGLAERQDEAEVQELLDRLNQEIVEVVQRSGLAPVMTICIRGRAAIRISICSRRTLAKDVDSMFEAIARWGRLLNTKLSVVTS